MGEKIELTEEYCGECESVIELTAKLGPQKCPECGKKVMPCLHCLDLDNICNWSADSGCKWSMGVQD